MSFDLRRYAEISPETLAKLRAEMAGFYRNPPPAYYRIADQASGEYNLSEYPFHCDLVEQVSPGDQVLELGCGTAHLCPYIERRGGIYTGVDHSRELLEQNRARFPRAHFVEVGQPLEKQFDFVASLYTLEHTVDPPLYLEQLRNYCRPGGSLAIICPEFVDGASFPNSIFYGRTARRLRQKLQAFSLLDTAAHVMDWKWGTSRWRTKVRESAPGSFWMNLQTAVLHGASYTIDADAVHLSRLKDIVWFFQQRGDSIVKTSNDMRGVSPQILDSNCYLVVRKSLTVHR